MIVYHERRVASVLTSYASVPQAEVFRQDTEQVYVASADMTLDSVGKYSYSFTDLGEEYEYSVEVKSVTVLKETIEVFGATDINYITPTDGNAYFEDHLWADSWTDATTKQKLWAIKEATVRLDALAFYSKKTVATQTKAFPRNGNTTIPQTVMDACADIALKLLDGVIPDEEVDKLQVSRESYAGGATTFKESSSGKPWIVTGILSQDAWKKLVPYMLNSNAIAILRA